MANLKAQYVFVSTTTGISYILNIETGPSQALRNIDNPNAKGYPIIRGTVSVVETNGESTKYTIPNETLYGSNALWNSAADSPSAPNGTYCSGIDRLQVDFPKSTLNTQIMANDPNSVSIVGCPTGEDSATLVHTSFPPK